METGFESKVVVIELDAVPVYHDTVIDHNGDYARLFQWGFSANDFSLSPLKTLKAIISEYFAVARHNRFWRALNSPSLISDNEYTGPGFKAIKGQLNNSKKEMFFTQLKFECEAVVADRNLASLRRLLMDLQKAGVKVKLLRPPLHKDYWQDPSTTIRNNYAEMALDVFLDTPEGDEANIIDLRYKWQFTNEYFTNWTHLNELGASRLSQHLARIIEFEYQ
ncbi:MAG: hypothetical protein QM501_04960 [Gimesia sp.]